MTAEIEKFSEQALAVRKALRTISGNLDENLAFQLALCDRNAGAAWTADAICVKYGITMECLDNWRREHRKDIERQDDEIFEAKKRIDMMVSKRIVLGNALIEAALAGDKVKTDQLRDVIKFMDQFFSSEELIAMSKVIGKDMEKAQTMNATQVNINIDPAISRAEELLRNRKKVIEIEEKK